MTATFFKWAITDESSCLTNKGYKVVEIRTREYQSFIPVQMITSARLKRVEPRRGSQTKSLTAIANIKKPNRKRWCKGPDRDNRKW